jgi:hypothetical protein
MWKMYLIFWLRYYTISKPKTTQLNKINIWKMNIVTVTYVLEHVGVGDKRLTMLNKSYY